MTSSTFSAARTPVPAATSPRRGTLRTGRRSMAVPVLGSSATSMARGLRGVAAEVALVLQRREVGVHGRGRRQADGLADLAHARRIALLARLGVDELEHLPLAGGQAGRSAASGGLGAACALDMGSTVTRSRVRGKHPFAFSLDIEQAFVHRSCLTPLVRSSRQASRSPPVHRSRRPMARSIQEHRHGRRPPARAPSYLEPVDVPYGACGSSSPIVSSLRPRSARRHQRAVYRRRRVLAALVGLGLVLTIARAGAALGGSSLATPERLPHVQHVVVQPGDTLWSIARRGRSRPRRAADRRPDGAGARHARPCCAGELISVPTP